MTSPVFRPNQPVSSTWAPQGGWYNAGQQAAQQQPVSSTGYDPGSAADLAAREAYIQTVVRALQGAEGFEKIKLQKQYEDAEKGRQNALQIAQLQAQTSRYGTDRNAEVQLAQLKENQRQFDAAHDLDLKKFGLDQQRVGNETGEAYTRFAQTYDDLFALQDLKANVASISQGGGAVPLQQQGQPHAKTWEDWAALTGVANQAGAGGGQVSASNVGTNGPMQGGAPTSTSDQRVTAANAVMKALPPSATLGHDGQDWAAINAITSLYLGAKPGEVEKLGTERRKAAMGALARAGYSPRLVEEERIRAGVGQGAVNRA